MSNSIAKFGLKETAYLFLVGIAGWWIPGAGHWIIGQQKRAIIIFFSLTFTFLLGIWIGSIAVIDAGTPWYWAQMLNSPAVASLAHLSHSLSLKSFGKPREIGELYTGITGLLNLLCIINAVYLAHSSGNNKEQKND